MNQLRHSFLLLTAFVLPGAGQQTTSASDSAFMFLRQGMVDLKSKFFMFETEDSGFNRGVASGVFAFPQPLTRMIGINAGCIMDMNQPDGCSKSPDASADVNLLQIWFPPLTGLAFAGVNIEEPEDYGVNRIGDGLDLRGATALAFQAAATSTKCAARVGVHGSLSDWLTFDQTLRAYTFDFETLNPPLRRLVPAHLLFTVTTDANHCSAGGSILLGSIKLTPVPLITQQTIGFPLSNRTIAIVPRDAPLQDTMLFPPDQANRNLTTIYESSLALLGLLHRNQDGDATQAHAIADAFVSALHPASSASLLPSNPKNSPAISSDDPEPPAILHNGYMSGPVTFSDDQPQGTKRGDVRLAGFTAASCSRFCLVLDGATGGNNAFAILALVAASRQFEGNMPGPYLRSARQIAKWIVANLLDPLVPPQSCGGYFVGWNDGGVFRNGVAGFNYGKSVENNADIFAAFNVLADREEETSDERGLASTLRLRAKAAGDFVVRMFDQGKGRFDVGTVPADAANSPGVNNVQTRCGQMGSADAINSYEFLDSQTFTLLALASYDDYRNTSNVDWRGALSWVLNNGLAQPITHDGSAFEGFQLVKPVDDNYGKRYSEGIAWEFTAQMVVAMRLADTLFPAGSFEPEIEKYMNQIQNVAGPNGIVAAMLDDSNPQPLYKACLNTPFQCIGLREGLAASLWGAFAEMGFNPLGRPQAQPATATTLLQR
jgi:hypothetical protein